MPLPKLKLKSETPYTVNEYLALERESLERHEYFDGEIYAMPGEYDAHGIVSANLSGELYIQLKNSDCQARIKHAKIKSGGFAVSAGKSTKGMYSYPDIVVICGEIKYHDKKKRYYFKPESNHRSAVRFDRRLRPKRKIYALSFV